MNGTVRKIDELGRIVIPKEIRDRLEVSEGDGFEVSEQDGIISLKKSEPKCMVCEEDAYVEKVGRAVLCSVCREAVELSLREAVLESTQ